MEPIAAPAAEVPTPATRDGHATVADLTPFTGIVRANTQGHTELARERLADLVDDLLDQHESTDLQSHIFAAALAKRLDGSRHADMNLYLRRFAADSQISLFGLVAQHLPTVSVAGSVGNDLLCDLMAPYDRVTLLDIGIGTGRQETAMLHELARRGTLPQQLTVFAVEPDPVSLAEAQHALEATARVLDLDLEFHGRCCVVEELQESDWDALGRTAGALVAFGAFAVHHVRPARGATDPRDVLFARLRALQPVGIVLCEPNSDHHTPDFDRRFTNCWRHFGQTFRLIEQLSVGTRERNAMKMFFAREIEDILANSEETRCERHEGVDTWLARLRRAGFEPMRAPRLHRVYECAPVEVTMHDGYVGLDYAGETLVSILCATGRAGRIEVQRDRASAVC
ncbi:MAG TPA: GRAS family protein [Gemmatimonadaceae bacterium]|nr:GRAS family protein [Gemmatimonadaceae bacterium]